MGQFLAELLFAKVLVLHINALVFEVVDHLPGGFEKQMFDQLRVVNRITRFKPFLLRFFRSFD